MTPCCARALNDHQRALNIHNALQMGIFVILEIHRDHVTLKYNTQPTRITIQLANIIIHLCQKN